MNLTNERTEEGVTERLFELTVAGTTVPGVVWTPAGADGARPLLLCGHGGGQHKKAPPVVAGAKLYAKSHGYAVAAIDAPDHGARLPAADLARIGEQMRAQIARAGGIRGEALDTMMALAAQATPEWIAALDALQSFPEIGTGGPVGYLGVSLGALVGIPFVAHEPRITAAVFGLAGVPDDAHPLARAAQRITVPIELALQWDDEAVPRESALALFGAFGSREKTAHVNTGGHFAVPPFERTSWERFFVRHLGEAGRAP